MRLVIQRVFRAALSTALTQELVSKIDNGLMVLVGITQGDDYLDIDNLVPKLLKVRLWDNEQG